MPQFELVKDDDAPAPQQSPAPDHAAAMKMIMLGLGTLGQRTLHALADLFCLLTVGSVFWVAMSIPQPDTMQLIKLGMYAIFVIVANWIVRRK